MHGIDPAGTYRVGSIPDGTDFFNANTASSTGNRQNTVFAGALVVVPHVVLGDPLDFPVIQTLCPNEKRLVTQKIPLSSRLLLQKTRSSKGI